MVLEARLRAGFFFAAPERGAVSHGSLICRAALNHFDSPFLPKPRPGMLLAALIVNAIRLFRSRT
jgi:hypothetical protein